MDQAKIGTFIQTMRKELGLTQKELADRIGISDKTVSKWETGNGLPDLSSMDMLCKTLNITVNELLSGEKLSPSTYSDRAEENMMNLLKENVESKKSNRVQIILGSILGVLSVITLILMCSGFNLSIISYFIDLPSLIILALIVVACLIGSGVKGKKNVVDLIKKVIVPAGVFVAVFALVIVLHSCDTPETIGSNLAVALLSMVYGLLIYIILIPISKRLE
ncbi:MAG: helix-turn-helix domain-containing protein [Lachnospiraceae bacterium]